MTVIGLKERNEARVDESDRAPVFAAMPLPRAVRLRLNVGTPNLTEAKPPSVVAEAQPQKSTAPFR